MACLFAQGDKLSGKCEYALYDAADAEAVQRWFSEVLPSLPTEQIEKILEELLAYDEDGDDTSGVRYYPKGVPLPSLEESPVAPVPLLAATPWKELIRALFVRHRGPTGK